MLKQLQTALARAQSDVQYWETRLAWYNKAKKDGKIDSKEAQDLANKINDGLGKLGDTLDEINKGDKE